MNTYDVALDNVWNYRVTANGPDDALTQAIELMTDEGLLFDPSTLLSVTINRVKWSQPVKLDGCTCGLTEDASVRAYHFKTCPWAM